MQDRGMFDAWSLGAGNSDSWWSKARVDSFCVTGDVD
jgi:hypothetical protein